VKPFDRRSGQQRKRSKKKDSEGGGLWKLPQPWKSTKDAFGDIFFIDFHRCLKKAYAKNASAFFTVTHRPDRD
jgi:hypothetical protein